MGMGSFEGYRSYGVEVLFNRFRTPLLAFFRRQLQRDDPEDLAQEVFVRLASHPDLGNIAHMDAYVFQVATNLVRDRRRSARAHSDDLHQSLDQASTEAHVPSALVEDIDPERVLQGKHTTAAVKEALAAMPQRTRDIFLLYRIEKMRQRDIAALLGISVSSVEKHVVKAITILTKVRDAK